jgi:hypothetical protein
VSDNRSPFGPFAKTNCLALLLEYAQVYIMQLAIAWLSGIAQQASKLYTLGSYRRLTPA